MRAAYRSRVERTATFTHTARPSKNFSCKVVLGRVSYRPSRMTWRYDNGNEAIVTPDSVDLFSDGKRDYQATPTSSTLGLVLAVIEGGNWFPLRYYPLQITRSRGTALIVVDEVDDGASRALSVTVVYIDPDSYLIQAVQSVDEQGTYRWDFVWE